MGSHYVLSATTIVTTHNRIAQAQAHIAGVKRERVHEQEVNTETYGNVVVDMCQHTHNELSGWIMNETNAAAIRLNAIESGTFLPLLRHSGSWRMEIRRRFLSSHEPAEKLQLRKDISVSGQTGRDGPHACLTP